MGEQLLQDIYLFKELLPKELEQISALGTVRTFNQGEEIFAEGDKAESLYVIRMGTVHIRRAGDDKNFDVVQLGSGAHFGEMAVVDGEPRSATAIAMERSELLEIGFPRLKAYFDQHPTIAVKFYHALTHFLARRLRVTTIDLSFARERNISHF